MKFKLPLSLLLLTSLSTACSVNLPQGVNLGGNAQQSMASAADIEAKADLFDVMLLSKDAAGNNTPVTPEQIASLKLDGQTINPSSILLPGAASSDSLVQANARQQEAAKAVNGQNVTMFGGNGAFSFVVPKTGKNSVLQLQLKGSNDSYQLIRFANLSRGTFVLGSKGQVQGGFNTRADFQTQAEGEGGVLSNLNAIFTHPGGYYALAQFSIGAFSNFYQAGDGSVKVTTHDNHELTFQPAQPDQASAHTQISDQQEAQARAEVTQQVGDSLSPLLGYIGSWTLESDLLKALIPGQKLMVTVANGSAKDSYCLTAAIAKGSYSGESKVVGSGDTSTLKLAVSAGGKSLGVQIKLVSSNRVSVQLTQANGVAELSGMVGTEIFLKRAL